MKWQFLLWEPGYLFRHLSCWWHGESARGTAMPRKAEQGCWSHGSCQFLPCIPESKTSLLLTVVRVWPKTEICWVYWFKLLHKSWILSFSSSRMLCKGWKMRQDQPIVMQKWSHSSNTHIHTLAHVRKAWANCHVCACWLHHIQTVVVGEGPRTGIWFGVSPIYPPLEQI